MFKIISWGILVFVEIYAVNGCKGSETLTEGYIRQV